MAPQTVSELYPRKWLAVGDLRGRSHAVTVKEAYTTQLYNQHKRQQEWHVVLDFGKKLDLILNKTQVLQMVAITKSEIFNEWAGTAIRLAPGRTENGKETIVISETESGKLDDIPQTQ